MHRAGAGDVEQAAVHFGMVFLLVHVRHHDLVELQTLGRVGGGHDDTVGEGGALAGEQAHLVGLFRELLVQFDGLFLRLADEADGGGLPDVLRHDSFQVCEFLVVSLEWLDDRLFAVSF